MRKVARRPRRRASRWSGQRERQTEEREQVLGVEERGHAADLVAAELERGEPVTVLLRSGHMLKVGRGFDEDAFVRVVALLEAG